MLDETELPVFKNIGESRRSFLGGSTNPLRGRGVCGAVEVMERALRSD